MYFSIQHRTVTPNYAESQRTLRKEKRRNNYKIIVEVLCNFPENVMIVSLNCKRIPPHHTPSLKKSILNGYYSSFADHFKTLIKLKKKNIFFKTYEVFEHLSSST